MIPEPRLNQLYQETILDHNRRPRNFRKIENATQYSHATNPLCGDDYHLYLVVDGNGIIQDVGFEGDGCAISKSSASMMTAKIKGKHVDEVSGLKDLFLRFMTAEKVAQQDKQGLSNLKIFEGVREFPIRVKCATLIWHALDDAIKDAGKTP